MFAPMLRMMLTGLPCPGQAEPDERRPFPDERSPGTAIPGPPMLRSSHPRGKAMKKTRGFTLIELMIVVAVVAILAALAITQYGKQVRKARRAEARQNIAAVAMAEEKYRMNNASYGTCALVLAPG